MKSKTRSFNNEIKIIASQRGKRNKPMTMKMMYIQTNLRYGYTHLEGIPHLYDRRVDVFYPCIFNLRHHFMIFNDFIHGQKLRLNYESHGFKMLDLSKIYIEKGIWTEGG